MATDYENLFKETSAKNTDFIAKAILSMLSMFIYYSGPIDLLSCFIYN